MNACAQLSINTTLIYTAGEHIENLTQKLV